MRNQKGFTLVELMVTIPVVLLVLYASNQILVANIMQFKQQTRIAEAGLESNIGLQILRRDLHHAGFGLPDGIPVTVAYTEASGTLLAANYNDGGSTAPRLVVSGNSTGFGGSDYLVIKSLCVAENRATGKYHLQDLTGVTNDWPPSGPSDRDLDPMDGVIVLKVEPSFGERLVVSSLNDTVFATSFNDIGSYAPPDIETTHIIYGVSESTALSFPFNRGDYYVTDGAMPYSSGTVVPSKCAPNTGVLVKSVLSHASGELDTDGSGGPMTSDDELPLVDCVADFQVVYGLDMDEDGVVGTLSNADGTSFESVGPGESTLVTATDVQATMGSAKLLKSRLEGVMIYVLAHEGQKDPSFEFDAPLSKVTVGPSITMGREFDFNTSGITDWLNYRWRLYRIVEKPEALL